MNCIWNSGLEFCHVRGGQIIMKDCTSPAVETDLHCFLSRKGYVKDATCPMLEVVCDPSVSIFSSA